MSEEDKIRFGYLIGKKFEDLLACEIEDCTIVIEAYNNKRVRIQLGSPPPVIDSDENGFMCDDDVLWGDELYIEMSGPDLAPSTIEEIPRDAIITQIY